MEKMPCDTSERHAAARQRLQTFTRRVDTLTDRSAALMDRTCALLHNGGIHPDAPEERQMTIVYTRIERLSLRLQSHIEHLIGSLKCNRFDTEACTLAASAQKQIERLPARRPPADFAALRRQNRPAVTPLRPAART